MGVRTALVLPLPLLPLTLCVALCQQPILTAFTAHASVGAPSIAHVDGGPSGLVRSGAVDEALLDV